MNILLCVLLHTYYLNGIFYGTFITDTLQYYKKYLMNYRIV